MEAMGIIIMVLGIAVAGLLGLALRVMYLGCKLNAVYKRLIHIDAELQVRGVIEEREGWDVD